MASLVNRAQELGRTTQKLRRGSHLYIYLHAYETVREVRAVLTSYFSFYNVGGPHQSLEYRTPDETYFATETIKKKAA